MKTHENQITDYPKGARIEAIREIPLSSPSQNYYADPLPRGTRGVVTAHTDDGRAWINFDSHGQDGFGHTFEQPEKYIRVVCTHRDDNCPANHEQATTEFDQVFDQMEAPEYPATCDNCGEVGTNASMEQHECDEHDAPAAPERGEWHEAVNGMRYNCSYPERHQTSTYIPCQDCSRYIEELNDQPRAWMRRWAYERKPCPPKVKNAKGRWGWPKESRFNEVTNIKIFADDVPLFATEQHSTLITQRERLLRLLRPVTSPTACYCAVMGSEKCWHCEARELIATIEQDQIVTRTTTGREGSDLERST